MSVLDIIPAGRDKVRIEGELYREPLGRKTEGTSQAVRERLAREFAERIRANLSRASGPTFDDIAVFFIEERLPELRPHGAERYKLSIKTMTPHFSGKAIGDIDTKALRAFETARRAQGCASGTIRRDLACAFAAIEFYAAVHEIEMENPPGRYLKRRANDKALVEAPPRTRYLSHAEEDRLLATAAARVEKDKRLRGLAESITFAIETGMRLDEQFSMRWPDVDMARKRATVIGKGGKKREVPLSEKAAQIVARFPRHLRVAEGQEWVWVDGERYPNRTKAFNSAADAGLKDVTWHDLRRTCGCRCLQDRGWNHAQVQLLLGHESVTTTERHYAFLNVENLHMDGHKIGGLSGTISGTGSTD